MNDNTIESRVDLICPAQKAMASGSFPFDLARHHQHFTAIACPPRNPDPIQYTFLLIEERKHMLLYVPLDFTGKHCCIGL